MSDIVERLRLCETHVMWADHAEIPKRWCKEAADEIERLRAALSAVVNVWDKRIYFSKGSALQEAAKAIETARAALKEQP